MLMATIFMLDGFGQCRVDGALGPLPMIRAIEGRLGSAMSRVLGAPSCVQSHAALR
ncbi:hypothetical protein HOE425_332610 [Hoeflea sp. EC-HK425]|nr:hypothetical protein HOE425_332610 [Hoeflea sp. EC-HK425]